MQQKSVALRKRSQIAAENRKMFACIAVVSVVVGFCLVGGIFLARMALFNEKVLWEKNVTVATLDDNIDIADELTNQVRVLDTNAALMTSKANEDDETLQVILDALPSEANSLALGASLQEKLLSGISGLKLNSLDVNQVYGVETLGDYQVVDVLSDSGSSTYEITFSFSVSGSETALKKVFTNLEKSIRTIDILSFEIEGQGDQQVMTVQARAFYEPAITVELKDKVIKQ